MKNGDWTSRDSHDTSGNPPLLVPRELVENFEPHPMRLVRPQNGAFLSLFFHGNHGNLRGPGTQCHVYPQEIAGVMIRDYESFP